VFPTGAYIFSSGIPENDVHWRHTGMSDHEYALVVGNKDAVSGTFCVYYSEKCFR